MYHRLVAWALQAVPCGAGRLVNNVVLLVLVLAAFVVATALADAAPPVASATAAAPVSQSVKVSGPAVAKATQAAAGAPVPVDELSSPGAALARRQGVPLALGFLAAHPQVIHLQCKLDAEFRPSGQGSAPGRSPGNRAPTRDT